MRSNSAMSGASVLSCVPTAVISRAKPLDAVTTNPRAGRSLSAATTWGVPAGIRKFLPA
ncbi:hypothetical protein [Nostoc sp. 106C]|uniref:hypothetical protein n=1 Tax=Nostoc sp. 106C TaxID=1932667 RepID=UPI0014123DBD|nr:hypothetical protein [Nostoc sp. 106C]